MEEPAKPAPSRPYQRAVFPLVRRVVRAVVFLLSLIALTFVGMLLVAHFALGGVQRVFRPGEWPGLMGDIGLTGVLLFLLGMLVGSLAVLSVLRALEIRIVRERRRQYQARRRERQPAAPEPNEAAIRAEAGWVTGVEAILFVDLVQSTELLAKNGDLFFRKLLRRIEATFIPIARRFRTRCVDGHGDALLFSFERPEEAYQALREMYAGIPAINRVMPSGVEIAFRASLHVGETLTDNRGNRTGLNVLRTVRLAGVMDALRGRGAGRNTLVVSADVLPTLEKIGASAKFLGEVELRGFPGTYPVYQIEP